MSDVKFVTVTNRVNQDGKPIPDAVFIEKTTIVDRCLHTSSRLKTEEDEALHAAEWSEFIGGVPAIDAPITKKSFFKAKGHK